MKHIVAILMVASLFLLIACGGSSGNRSGGSDDWVYGIVVYVDSTSVDYAISDSLTVHCAPRVSSIERIGVDRFRIRGMREGQRYKLSVKFGIREQLLVSESAYRTGQEIVLRIPKSIEGAVLPVGTREESGVRQGRAIREIQ